MSCSIGDLKNGKLREKKRNTPQWLKLLETELSPVVLPGPLGEKQVPQ